MSSDPIEEQGTSNASTKGYNPFPLIAILAVVLMVFAGYLFYQFAMEQDAIAQPEYYESTEEFVPPEGMDPNAMNGQGGGFGGGGGGGFGGGGGNRPARPDAAGSDAAPASEDGAATESSEPAAAP